MSIYVISEMEKGKVRRIYGTSRYPSTNMGNIFIDFRGDVNLAYADSLPLKIRDFYSIVAIRPSHILISRDVLGGKPLYYDPENVSISSFRDVLEFPVELNPGEIIKLDYNGDILERKIYNFEDVFRVQDSEDTFEKETNSVYDDIKETIFKKLERYKADGCVAFSGGLDSSVLAKIYDLELISVTANPKEKEWLERSGKAIGKDVEIKKFTADDVKDVLPDVLRAIETSNPVQVSIAIPIFILMSFAKEMGYKEVVFGQGADELFGGYMRYIGMDEVELKKATLQDIRNIGRDNLVRDNKVAYTLEMKIHTPYLQWDIIELALNLPMYLKIRKENGKIIRKYILRKLALEILPEEIAFREKKAIQYSTRTMDILRKIARENGMKVNEYLEKLRKTNKFQ